MSRLLPPSARARRSPRGALLVAALVAAAATAACWSGGPASATTASTAPVDLSGVTINVADQLKEYETAFAATGDLNGAKYKVNWSEFIGGPPVIASLTGGSVDLGVMAETPTIFAQAAHDPVKVVAITEGSDPKASPFAILVPKGSPIKTVAQLRGHTIAVAEGTVEQYVLIQMLKKAHVPTSAVTLDNLTITDASTAVANGKVDAAVSAEPLTGLDLQGGKVTVLTSGAGYVQNLGYVTASQSALDNPKKAAAIADFIARFYKANAYLATHKQLSAQTYVKTYGVPLSVALQAVNSVSEVGAPITPAIIKYQQAEADTFTGLGLIQGKLNVSQIFDLPFNKKLVKQAGIS
jgi:sulfonate transport system substrate-binding protein